MIILFVMVFVIQFSLCTVLFIRPQGKFPSGPVFCFQHWDGDVIFRESMQPDCLYSLGMQNCCIMFYQRLQSCLIFPVFFYAWADEFHRIAEVGRELWMSSGPTPQLKQAYLELVTQDNTEAAFEYLQGWRVHNLPV